MQSSYRVIKGASVVSFGKKEIVTEYIPKIEEEISLDIDLEIETNNEHSDINYKELEESILEQAKIKSNAILSEAYKKAEKIQKESYDKAYELGYAQGKDKGYTDAYEEGYKKNIKKAQEERDSLIKEAQNTSSKIIESSKLEYLRYLDEKKEEIIKTIKNIVESVFKREIRDADSLNDMVLDALTLAKEAKSLILRCREKYEQELKNTIEVWKTREVFKGEVFIIIDETIPEGNVMIEKDNGKILISVDKALEKIEEILFSE